MMKKTLLLFLLGFLILQTSFAQRSKLVPYDEDRPLTWKDFKARPSKSSSAAAVTSSGIEIGLTGDEKEVRVLIKSTFDPKESWTKDKKSMYLLSHEQFHFHITELHARLLRKEIQQLKDNSTKKLMKKCMAAYQRNKRQLNKYQNLYDSETKHSINKASQKQWEEKIRNELKALSAYTAIETKLVLN